MKHDLRAVQVLSHCEAIGVGVIVLEEDRPKCLRHEESTTWCFEMFWKDAKLSTLGPFLGLLITAVSPSKYCYSVPERNPSV